MLIVSDIDIEQPSRFDPVKTLFIPMEEVLLSVDKVFIVELKPFMNEYQITFFVDDPAANSHAAQPLSRLAKKFKSTIRIINITKTEPPISPNPSRCYKWVYLEDLCQITAVGIDAELACFVLKDVIAEHYVMVGSQVNHEFSKDLIQRMPQICPLRDQLASC